MTDVLVVGGSLAGASTAIHLARRGLRVQVLERAEFPRRKACGEGLFARGVEMLDELGVLEEVMAQSRVLETLRVEIGGAYVEAALPAYSHPALGVRREVVDSALLRRARDCGVDVHFGVTALGLLESDAGYRGVLTDQGEVEAKAIVVADGLRSRLRRIAGLEASTTTRRYGVSGRYELREPVEPRVQIRMLRGREIYVTPVGEREVNVALLTGKRESLGLAGDLAQSFDAIIRGSGVLPGNATPLDRPIAAGPFPARALRDWRANLILAGDAAGFFDGISGEGMSHALVCSKAAADAVHGFLETGDGRHFADYQRFRRKLARNSTLIARASLLLAGHPWLGRRAIGNLGKKPGTFEKVLAINAGVSGLSVLGPVDLRCLLLGL